jgi:hypothetical protein
MGVRPWREAQPDFPPEILGIILSTYFGGRSEVRIRREIVRVQYVDFLSMYPTVCTLIGLWRFVTAEALAYENAAETVRELLARVTLSDLQRPPTWGDLGVLVQVQPQADILPVRARYGMGGPLTIGLNFLTAEEPLWYTLADCITSKLLTGRAPQVIRALQFRPVGVQNDMSRGVVKSVAIRVL